MENDVILAFSPIYAEIIYIYIAKLLFHYTNAPSTHVEEVIMQFNIYGTQEIADLYKSPLFNPLSHCFVARHLSEGEKAVVCRRRHECGTLLRCVNISTTVITDSTEMHNSR